MTINGNLKTVGLATALISAIVLGVWGQVFQRLWDPRYTEEKQNAIVQTQETLKSVTLNQAEAKKEREELRKQLIEMDKKLDILLWKMKEK